MIFHEMERAALFAYKTREKIFTQLRGIGGAIIDIRIIQIAKANDQLFQLIIISIIFITIIIT